MTIYESCSRAVPAAFAGIVSVKLLAVTLCEPKV
jgi:hypothetical protein